jgi:hypothetical protein
MQSYWTGSKCRHERWGRLLKQFSEATAGRSPASCSAEWRKIRPVLEEILGSEVLSRVWTALAAQYDALSGADEFLPVANNVYLAHAESRNRALNILVFGPNAALADAVRMNRLRRRIEHWNDVLIGGLLSTCDASSFAFDARRARNYAADLTGDDKDLSLSAGWQLLRASLSAVFRSELHPAAPSADLNREIAGSILACLDDQCFDQLGLLRSVWLDRLSHVTRDAEGWLEQIVGESGASAADVRVHRLDPPASGPRAPRF